MAFLKFLIIVLFAGLVGASVAIIVPQKATLELKETAYERVLRTRTLRCAYMAWPMLVERDPNTGKLSGYLYDYMEAIGASLGIKIEWNTEIAVGTQVEVLVAGKADAICDDAPMQTAPTLQLAYTEPLAYFPVFAFVRSDDTRFTDKNDRINAPDVKASMIDGDLSHEILRTLYTEATPVPLPQLADGSQMMMEVVSHKADVVLIDDLSIAPFLANNPGKLRKLSNTPIIVTPGSISVLRTETALTDMISQATKNVRDRGLGDIIDAKYGIGTALNVYPAEKRYKVN